MSRGDDRLRALERQAKSGLWPDVRPFVEEMHRRGMCCEPKFPRRVNKGPPDRETGLPQFPFAPVGTAATCRHECVHKRGPPDTPGAGKPSPSGVRCMVGGEIWCCLCGERTGQRVGSRQAPVIPERAEPVTLHFWLNHMREAPYGPTP